MTCSNNIRQLPATLMVALLMVCSGCMVLGPKRGSIPEEEAGRPSPQEARLQASRSLTEQAQTFLAQDNPEEALRLLERAVTLDPQDGETYYWLAESWILKDNSAQALEYHRLALRYLQAKPDWVELLSEQKERIMGSDEEASAED